MNRISLTASREAARRKADTVLEGTVIHQRPAELALGRWDFAVFGPEPDSGKAVLRIGVAEQMMIQRAQVYLAAVGDPADVGHPGMISIEDLTGGDVSEELHGLEVYNVSPIRPLAVAEKRTGGNIDRMRAKVIEEFSGRNLAIIETPDEGAWSLSVLSYLDECDRSFGDPFITSILEGGPGRLGRFNSGRETLH